MISSLAVWLAALVLGFTPGAPSFLPTLGIFMGFVLYVVCIRFVEPWLARKRVAATDTIEPRNTAKSPSAPADLCRRCRRKIVVNPALSADVFEGMHWLCFHLEYEHEGDPDVPCSDYSSCPWWTIAHLEKNCRIAASTRVV